MVVSIPNGMEFYVAQDLTISQLKKRFNSQRDGILLSDSSVAEALMHVSIPNGMEFYIGGSLEFGTEECFNSQRDGILPPCIR